HLVRAARQGDRKLRAVSVGQSKSIDRARRDVEVSRITDEQPVIGVQRIAIDRSRQIARTRDIADIGFEVLNLIENSRIIQNALQRAIMGTESAVERHTLSRTGVELPNHSISEAFEVATAAALP